MATTATIACCKVARLYDALFQAFRLIYGSGATTGDVDPLRAISARNSNESLRPAGGSP